MKRSLSIAMVGTRGAPAHYGGFETAVEEIGVRLADRGHRFACIAAQVTLTSPAHIVEWNWSLCPHCGSEAWKR